MDIGGIIASALGGGAGAVQSMAQSDIDTAKRAQLAQQLSDIEEARATRMLEAQQRAQLGTYAGQQDIDLQYAPQKTEAAAARQQVVGDIQAQQQISTETAAARARAQAALDATRAYATDPTVAAGARAQAVASHVWSPLEVAQANNLNALTAARKDLAAAIAAGDTAGEQSAKSQLDALTYQSMQPRSYADITQSANNFRLLAAEKRREAQDEPSPIQRQALIDQAKVYEDTSAALGQSVMTRRMVPTPDKPAPAPAPTVPPPPRAIEILKANRNDPNALSVFKQRYGQAALDAALK